MAANGLRPHARSLPSRVTYMPVVATPQLVEERLHAGHDAEFDEEQELFGGDHLDMFEAVASGSNDIGSDVLGGFAQGSTQHLHGAVTDHVESGLHTA